MNICVCAGKYVRLKFFGPIYFYMKPLVCFQKLTSRCVCSKSSSTLFTTQWVSMVNIRFIPREVKDGLSTLLPLTEAGRAISRHYASLASICHSPDKDS